MPASPIPLSVWKNLLRSPSLNHITGSLTVLLKTPTYLDFPSLSHLSLHPQTFTTPAPKPWTKTKTIAINVCRQQQSNNTMTVIGCIITFLEVIYFLINVINLCNLYSCFVITFLRNVLHLLDSYFNPKHILYHVCGLLPFWALYSFQTHFDILSSWYTILSSTSQKHFFLH